MTGPPSEHSLTVMDLSSFQSEFSIRDKVARVLWSACWIVAFRYSPKIMFAWRRLVLSMFGAKIGRGVRIHPNVRFFYPKQLAIGDYSIIGPNVDVYNVSMITIGSNSVISQYSYLCSATHDHSVISFPLVKKPIVIEDQVWVAADSYIGPGVTVGRGAVVGARASAYKDVEAWSIVGGNPARVIGKRKLNAS